VTSLHADEEYPLRIASDVVMREGGQPVIVGAGDRIESARRTGSSAFADDDGSRTKSAGQAPERHCEERSDRSNPFFPCCLGLLRGACHRPRVRATRWLAMTTKEKGRLVSQAAFPFLRQLHIDGRFQNFCTRGLSPSRVLLGSRCQSGQSRTGARTDAMVSHLRKMTNQASIAVRTQGTAKHISPLFTDALS
jgi:hypothetical protein